jgi:hypothetical protein
VAFKIAWSNVGPDMPSDKIYSKVEEFRATFQNQYGSLDCFDLIGCDFNMETERQRWKKTGLENKCKEFTAVSARIIIEIVAKEKVDS